MTLGDFSRYPPMSLLFLGFCFCSSSFSGGDNGQAGIFGFGEGGGHLSSTWTEETSVAHLLQAGKMYIKV